MLQSADQINALLDLPKPEVFLFFGFWQLITCLFSAVALFGIWWHLGKRRDEFGMIWLALAVLFWSFSGLAELYYADRLERFIRDGAVASGGAFNRSMLEANMQTVNIRVESMRSILSLFNSAFILLALPGFRHIPKPILPIIRSQSWIFIVFFPFIISLIINLGILVGLFTPAQTVFVNTLDLVYAILITLPFLGWILWESFEKRGLKTLAWLSLISIALTVIAQISKLNEDYLFKAVSSGIFKPILIMLFFALVMSWMKELSENPALLPQQLFLAFKRTRLASGKFGHEVQLTLPPHFHGNDIRLTRSRYNLLYKFAERKLRPDPEQGEWLEIKPKNDARQNRTYDIKDHNEMKRLIDNLLEEVFAKKEVPVYRQFLKDALFEVSDQQDRKIRLRIPRDNISLN